MESGSLKKKKKAYLDDNNIRDLRKVVKFITGRLMNIIDQPDIPKGENNQIS
uniref:Uncharacterized protein n=1 Tax=Rhizophagus irregularis (strain DAOM 181602 / DAOM 197198 / MUCL 43194) TaxID=747089 RepID=U9SJM7_RHIID